MQQIWQADQIFDGETLHSGQVLLIKDGVIAGLIDRGDAPTQSQVVDLGAGILCPGLVDLQVNGGGGVMLGQGDADAVLATICAAHGRLGTLALLPTLITSDAETLRAVLEAGQRAANTVPGFRGLHLEGPFLDPKRAGAHDASLIRRMTEADMTRLIVAARTLPALMITVAPESAHPAQIAALTAAGIIVSLGHSDTTEVAARTAITAGASCVTHLYNAMSPLGHRAPGLVGAALDSNVLAGIIPDGVHVSRTAFRVALRAKPERLFAVSDAMAVAGTDLQSFSLNGRAIQRRAGRLTLADGTLAGADISLPQAVRWMVHEAEVPLATALAMVTAIPAKVMGWPDAGRLNPGAPADLVHLGADFTLRGVWRGGQPLAP